MYDVGDTSISLGSASLLDWTASLSEWNPVSMSDRPVIELFAELEDISSRLLCAEKEFIGTTILDLEVSDATDDSDL